MNADKMIGYAIEPIQKGNICVVDAVGGIRKAKAPEMNARDRVKKWNSLFCRGQMVEFNGKRYRTTGPAYWDYDSELDWITIVDNDIVDGDMSFRVVRLGEVFPMLHEHEFKAMVLPKYRNETQSEVYKRIVKDWVDKFGKTGQVVKARTDGRLYTTIDVPNFGVLTGRPTIKVVLRGEYGNSHDKTAFNVLSFYLEDLIPVKISEKISHLEFQYDNKPKRIKA